MGNHEVVFIYDNFKTVASEGVSYQPFTNRLKVNTIALIQNKNVCCRSSQNINKHVAAMPRMSKEDIDIAATGGQERKYNSYSYYSL